MNLNNHQLQRRRRYDARDGSLLQRRVKARSVAPLCGQLRKWTDSYGM